MADFKQIIYNRRSIRRFSDELIEKDKINELVKAALLAPSGKSTYPCDFIVVNQPEQLAKLSQAKSHGATLLASAPLAIVITADTSTYDVWVEDASIASAYVMLEAENQGLGCCWVQMHLRGTADGKSATENLKETLNLPETHQVLSVLAIGYKEEDKDAYSDEDLKWNKIHQNSIGNS